VSTCVIWGVALLLAVFGVLDLVHCLLVAVCVTALLVVWPHVLPDMPRLPALPHRLHPGARRDLSDLSWSVTDRDGRASAKALARVGALADSAGLYALATTIGQTPSPSLNQVLDWLDSIDEKVKYD